MMAGWVSACGAPHPLVDTPIVGGSPEARAAVLAELAAFDEATGGGRTPVSRVEFTDLGGPYGVYRRTSHAVLLDASLPTEPHVFYNVSLVLRHELCHALNQQEDLHLERPMLYDALSDELVLHEGACTSERCRQDEAFAQKCHYGPWISSFAAAGCPDDPAPVDVFQHLAERVWVATDEPRPTPLEPPWASVELAAFGEVGPIDRVWAYTTSEHPELLKIVWSDEYHNVVVDRRTGESVSGVFDFHWNLVPPPAGLDPLVLRVDAGNAWSAEGPYAGLAVAQDIDGVHERYRQIWYDGERWALVGDGCQQPGVWAQPFATDQVFSLEVDGTRVSWAPVATTQ